MRLKNLKKWLSVFLTAQTVKKGQQKLAFFDTIKPEVRTC